MNINRLLQHFTQFAAVMVLSAIMVGNASAQDIYVNSSGGSDAPTCNGSSPNVATLPNCPFKTLTQALAVASSNDVIEVAAGVYPGPHTFGTSNITVQARNVGLNTNVSLTGNVSFTSSVTFLSVGAFFYPTGDVNLTAGTVSIDASSTFNLKLAGNTTITRTNGSMDGGLVNNAAPNFGPMTTLLYNSAAFSVDQVAGNEVPSDMGGGTLTVTLTGGGGPTLTFPASFTAGPTTITGGNTANVSFSQTLIAESIDINDANTHSFGNAEVTDDDFVMDGGATVTTGNLVTNGYQLIQDGSGVGSFTSTGTVSNSEIGSNEASNGDGPGNAWIYHDGASMTLNNVDLTFGYNNDSTSDVYIQTIQKVAGDLTISGTVTEGYASDINETDESWIAILVESGVFTVAQYNTFSGDVENDATLSFNAGGMLNGDVLNNTSGTSALINIGSGVLNLTADPGDFAELNDFNGPGKLFLSGDGNVPATGINTEGDLELGGTNDAVGGAPLIVGGELIISGDANWATAGGVLTISGGDATFSGSLGTAGLATGNTLTVTSGNVLFDSSTSGDVLADINASGNLVIESDIDLDGDVSVGGNVTLKGLNDIGTGVAQLFSTDGDLNIQGTTIVDLPGTTNANVGGTLFVASAATLAFLPDSNIEFTADAVDIFQQTGGGPPNGTIILGADNQLTVQGSFVGGTFIGIDPDLDADHATLYFAMPDNNSVFAPGPDTKLCDFAAYGNELTLSVTVSFEVQCNAYILDDSTVNLTDILMRMTGTDAILSIETDASVTSTPGSGAVSFEGADGGDADAYAATIEPAGASLGHITSLIINTSAAQDVSTTGNLEINGIVSLSRGGFTTEAHTVTFTGPNAGIIVNTDGTNTNVDTVTNGPGALAGSWDVTYNGAWGNAGLPGVELSPTKVNDLTVNTTVSTPLDGAGTTISISGNFTVASGAIATIVDPLTVAGMGNLAGTTAGAALTFSGAAGQTHTVSGTVTTSLTTFASNATVTGNGNMSATTVNAAVTIANLNYFTGLLTVGSTGDLSLGLVTTLGCDCTAGASGTTQGILVVAGGSIAQTSRVSNVTGGVAIGVAGAATLDLANNNLRLYGGSSFTSYFTSTLGTTGQIMANGGAVTLNTNVGGTTDPANIHNLIINVATSITGGVEVDSWTDVNAPLSAGFLIVSGTVDMGSTISSATTIIGTQVNVEGSQSFGGTLTINSTSGVDFVEASVAAQSTLTITGTYFQIAGDVSYDDVHIRLLTGLVHTAGAYTAGDTDDEFQFASASFSSVGDVIIQTVRIASGTTVISGAGDHLNAWRRLELDGSIQVGAGGPCVSGILTIGGGGVAVTVNANGGNVNIFCGPVNFGPEALKLAYNGTGTSNDEMPTTPFGELEINSFVALDRSPTVDLLDLNASSVATGGNTISIADGGSVAHGTGAANGITGNAVVHLGSWTLNYDATGGASVVGLEWPTSPDPGPTTLLISTGTTTVPATGGIRNTHNVTVASGATLELAATGLNVTGDLTVPGTVLSTGGGALNIVGTEPQLTTGPLTLPTVVMANGMGLTLGGNLTIGTTMTFTAGAVTTGPFWVTLPHGGTALQGYTWVAGGVDGNVRKQVVGGPAPMPADRMTFPTVTADGMDFRPASVTFNNPSQVSGAAASGIFLIVAHHETAIGGNNNLPLTTVDDLGNPLVIARYPAFHWSIIASAGLSPSADYDVELDADGFDAFVGERIELVRMIRRQAGAITNFLLLIGPNPLSNDNFAISPTHPVAVVRNAVGALIASPGALFTMGLESNMVATAPSAIAMNNGDTVDLDLNTVFSGGTGDYTYTITPANGGIASASLAGDILTITGAGVGNTTISMKAVDELNDSRTTQVTVQVNPVFVAGDIDDAELTVGGDNTTYAVNLLSVFSGGTPPAGYAVVVATPATATAVIVGNTLTVTATAAGSTNITVTGTDATTATASTTFNVAVNAMMTGAAIADQDIVEGEEIEVDLATIFDGGDGDYTYAVTSSSSANVTGAESGGTLTVEAVDAYTAGTTIGTVTVTVVATDGLGDTASSSITVDVFPVLGDLDGSGGPSPASAGITLDYYLGLTTLTAKQIGAADMDGDTFVIPYDAALNFAAFFAKDEIAANVGTMIEFGEVTNESNLVSIPVVLRGGDLNEVVSMRLDSQIDPSLATVQGVESNLGDGWLVRHSVSEDGLLRIAIAGYGEMTPDGVVATISLVLNDGAAQLSLAAEGGLNNNPVSNIEEIEIAELPDTFTLDGNYPNPFNPSTTIQFNLPESAQVEIQIFDMLGRRVMAIPAQAVSAGANRSIQLNASQLASGSYLYRVIARMDSKTQVEQGRMMLLK